VSGTVWSELDESSIELDAAELEKTFAQKVIAPKDKSVNPEAPKKKKADIVDLIDPKRAYSVNIALARFKMSFVAIADAVMAMDTKVLNEEALLVLASAAPDPMESETVASYDGPGELGKCEQFFLAMKAIPQVKKRLELMLFVHHFNTNFEEVETGVRVCINVLSALRESEHIRKLSEITLALGNYLNAGTRKGGAYGFDLRFLTKLSNTKSTNNKISLLEYVITLVESKFPETGNFVSELADIEAARKVETNWITGKIGQLSAGLRDIKRELQNPGTRDENVDRFVPVMTVFDAASQPKLDKLKKSFQTLEKLAVAVARYWGCDAKQMTMEALFELFSTFVREWKQSEAKLTGAKNREAVEAKKAALKAGGKGKVPGQLSLGDLIGKSGFPGKGPGSTAEGAVDTVVNMLGKDIGDLSKSIRSRRQKAADSGVRERGKSKSSSLVQAQRNATKLSDLVKQKKAQTPSTKRTLSKNRLGIF